MGIWVTITVFILIWRAIAFSDSSTETSPGTFTTQRTVGEDRSSRSRQARNWSDNTNHQKENFDNHNNNYGMRQRYHRSKSRNKIVGHKNDDWDSSSDNDHSGVSMNNSNIPKKNYFKYNESGGGPQVSKEKPINLQSNKLSFQENESFNKNTPLNRCAMLKNLFKPSINSTPQMLTDGSSPNKSTSVISKKELSSSVSTNDSMHQNSVKSELNNIAKFSLRPEPLPRNAYTEVKVENLINNQEAWVTRTEPTTDLLKLSLDGDADAKKTTSIKNPCQGGLYYAYFEGMWFRAVVVSVTPIIRIRYPDFGIEEQYKGELREIRDNKQRTIPPQAVLIHLLPGASAPLEKDSVINVKPMYEKNDISYVRLDIGLYSDDEPESLSISKGSHKEESIVPVPISEPNKSQLPSVSHASASKPEIERKENNTEMMKMMPEIGIVKISKIIREIVRPGSRILITITERLQQNYYIILFVPEEFVNEIDEFDNALKKIEIDENYRPQVLDWVILIEEHSRSRALVMEEKDNGYWVADADQGRLFCADCAMVPLPSHLMEMPLGTMITSLQPDQAEMIKDQGATYLVANEITDFNITGVVQVNNCNLTIKLSPWLTPPEMPAPSEDGPTIKEGDLVRIIKEHEGYIYLRNKTLHNTERHISEQISQTFQDLKLITCHPKPGTYVAVRSKRDRRFYRAVVVNVGNSPSSILLAFLDQGDREEVEWSTLRELSHVLIKQPLAIARIRLRRFPEGPFSPEQTERFVEYIDNRVTFTLSTNGGLDNEIDLIRQDNNLSVSEELIRLGDLREKEKEAGRAALRYSVPAENARRKLYTDLGKKDGMNGSCELIVLQMIGDTSFGFIVNDKTNDAFFSKMKEDLREYVEFCVPDEPYIPVEDELVLTLYKDNWQRAYVIDTENSYNLFLLDESVSTVSPVDKMRRMPFELVDIPARAYIGILEDIPEPCSDRLKMRIRELVINKPGLEATLTYKEDSDIYGVHIPILWNSLKKEKLI